MVLRAVNELMARVGASFVPNRSPLDSQAARLPGPAVIPGLAVIIDSGLVSTGGCRRPFAFFQKGGVDPPRGRGPSRYTTRPAPLTHAN
jgi:hypothetical protein